MFKANQFEAVRDPLEDKSTTFKMEGSEYYKAQSEQAKVRGGSG